jgi:uncharacterized caspase-like protein
VSFLRRANQKLKLHLCLPLRRRKIRTNVKQNDLPDSPPHRGTSQIRAARPTSLRPHEEVAHTQGEEIYESTRPIPNLATTEAAIQADRTILNPLHLGIEAQDEKREEETARRPTDTADDKASARQERRCIQAARVLKGEFPYRGPSTWTRLAKGSSALEQARQFEQYAFKHWEEKSAGSTT